MQIQKHFRLSEFACKCGCDQHIYQRMNIVYLSHVLQVTRDFLGSPVQITSGYRCPIHNRSVGGAPRSMHVHGLAADVKSPGHTPADVERVLAGAVTDYFDCPLYIIPYDSFVHVDLRFFMQEAHRQAQTPAGLDDPSGLYALGPGH